MFGGFSDRYFLEQATRAGELENLLDEFGSDPL
jgi:hypothetical protein